MLCRRCTVILHRSVNFGGDHTHSNAGKSDSAGKFRGKMQAAKTFSQLKWEQGFYKGRDRDYERRRMADPKLAASKRFRGSQRWKKFRDWFKKRYPICCDPFDLHPGRPIPTQQVHHIVGLTERLDLGLVESNCAPTCNPCHGKLEGMTRAHKETKHLFANIERPEC